MTSAVSERVEFELPETIGTACIMGRFVFHNNRSDDIAIRLTFWILLMMSHCCQIVFLCLIWEVIQEKKEPFDPSTYFKPFVRYISLLNGLTLFAITQIVEIWDAINMGWWVFYARTNPGDTNFYFTSMFEIGNN